MRATTFGLLMVWPKPIGRLVAPLQGANGAQALVVVDKTPQGLRQTTLEPVNFVPLKSGTS